MRAILEFNLPEEKCEHLIAVHAMGWALTAWDMDAMLRTWLKHGHEFKDADVAIESIRDSLHEILDSRGLSLEMIE